MMRRLSRSRSRSRPRTGDRGSVSLWLVIFALVSFVLLAFIIDGGQIMNARERAADIAGQAARAGADTVSVASLRGGGAPQIPQGACDQASSALVAGYAKGSLSASAAGGTTVTPCNINGVMVGVTVTVTVTPVIPVIFGSFNTSATETASLQCGNATQSTGAC